MHLGTNCESYRYLVQVNWDKPTQKPKFDSCSVFSIKPIDYNHTLPVPNHNESMTVSLELFRLEFNSFWVQQSKNWRDGQTLKADLKTKFEKMQPIEFNESLKQALKQINIPTSCPDFLIEVKID